MDSGVVDRCSCPVCKLDDRGDGFVGEGTGLVGTEGGEELKGISLKTRDFGEGILSPLWDCSDKGPSTYVGVMGRGSGADGGVEPVL